MCVSACLCGLLTFGVVVVCGQQKRIHPFTVELELDSGFADLSLDEAPPPPKLSLERNVIGRSYELRKPGMGTATH